MYKAFLFCFLQLKDAIPYNTMMGFGNMDITLDVDFSGSSSNEAEFELEVLQEGGTEENRIKMNFDVEFESQLSVSMQL